MDPLLKSIREAPLSYLPSVSLEALAHFQAGYATRSLMEGQPHDWGIDRHEFHEWLCERFQLHGAAAIGDTHIVSSYSLDEADAFRNYFALVEEFLSSGHRRKPDLRTPSQRQDFVGVIKAIRERPALYLGHATFRGCCAYLFGDERAYQDLGLTREDGRLFFQDFKKWVEMEKNQAAARPWFKVIEFWSGGIDCGHTPGGAFAIFFKWLDEYARSVGKKGSFSVSRETW